MSCNILTSSYVVPIYDAHQSIVEVNKLLLKLFFFVNLGLNYVRNCVKQSLITRFKNFMSIDWLPLEETRRFPHHVYTEPCWTRTTKGNLFDEQIALDKLYDIFTIYKEKGTVLAEGSLFLSDVV